MRTILLLLALLFATTASAVELTWTAPTQNTDGTPLTDLAGYRIHYGTVAGGPYPNTVDVSNPNATSATITLPSGTYYFVATAKNVAGIYSDFSNQTTKTVIVTPNPPGALTVTDLVAYAIVKQEDKLVMLPVGTVPADTPCDATQTANGKYAVPADQVTWAGTVQELVVFANCG